MAWGKKLLLSISVFAIRQRKRLPDGSRVKRQFPVDTPLVLRLDKDAYGKSLFSPELKSISITQ